MFDPRLKKSPPEWISMQEAARNAPYSQEYLSLLARRGKIFAKKIGRNWYTTREALEKYITEQAILASSLYSHPSAKVVLTDVPSQDKTSPASPDLMEEFKRLNPQVFQSHETPKALAPEIVPAPAASPISAPEEKNIKPKSKEVLEKLDRLSDSLEVFADRISRAAVAPKQEVPLQNHPEAVFPRITRMNRLSKSIVRTPTRLMAVMVTAVVMLFILVGGFSFGQADLLAQRVKKALTDATTLDGHFAGTHANEVLVLDKAGNIAIYGHIETEGQLRSRAPDGVAPIVVDSMTKVENLTADYLDDLDSKDFTLAFVTKNGNITYEDVYLEGKVEVGKSLVVKGATKLLDSLQVYGTLGVFSDAVFSKDVTLSGGNLVIGKGTIKINNTSLIKNLNAEYLDGITKSGINLQFVTSNGSETTNSITVGGLTANGVAFFNNGLWGKTGSFGLLGTDSLGVNKSATIGDVRNPSVGSLQIYTNQFTLDANGNATISETTTTDDLVVSDFVRSNLIPSGSYDLGSSANPWDDLFAIDGTFTGNLVVSGSLNFAGTSSNSFVVNTDNTSADTEDSYIAFHRGSVTPSARLTWNSTLNRFDFNSPVNIASTSFTVVGNTFLSNASASAGFESNYLKTDTISTSTGTLTINAFTLGGAITAGSNNITGVGLFSAGNASISTNFEVGGTASISSNARIGGNLTVVGHSALSAASTSGNFEIGGLLQLADGTDGSPSLSFTNDLDLGLYRIGANSLGITAGGRKTVTVNQGEVILNSSSSTPPTAFGSSYLKIGGTDAVLGATQTIGFGYSGNSTQANPAEIGFIVTDIAGQTRGDLVFATRNVTSNTAATERVRITAAGNLGIGTTSPSALVDIVGDSTLFRVASSSNVRFTILENGNVGIGTSGPQARLEVSGNANDGILVRNTSGAARIEIQGFTTNDNAELYFKEGNNERWAIYNDADDSDKLKFHEYSVGTAIMTLVGGNVGVGATSPATRFNVSGGAGLFGDELLVTNALQVGSASSVSYSRFGTGTTANGLSTSDDLLITGDLEIQGNSYFSNSVFSAASISTNFEVTGVIKASDGSATAPSYTFSNDEDTGLFRIGANSLGITTGGTRRASFSDTGASFSVPFELSSTASIGGNTTIRGDSTFTGTTSDASAAVLTLKRASGTEIAVFNNNGTVQINGAVQPWSTNSFDLGGTSAQWRTGYFGTSLGVNFGGALNTTFEVGGTASISGTAYFGSNVGIGTTSLAANLHIETSGGGTLRVGRTSNSGFLQLESDGTDAVIRSQGATKFQLGGSTERVTFNSAGNVGIGTTSPTTKFEVQGTASASYGLFSTLQVGGYSSASYNRFGTATTGHSLSATNDLLVSGNFEIDGTAYFDGASIFGAGASISGNFDPGANNTYDLGGTSNTWRNIYAGTQVITPAVGDISTNKITFDSVGTRIGFVLHGISSSPIWGFNASGALVTPQNNNVYDIGRSDGTTSPASGYFYTRLQTPELRGGTSTTSSLTLKTTSGVGTTGADIIFQVGNNGATEAMRILNSGNLGIGTSSPTALTHIVGDISTLFNVASGSNSRLIVLENGNVGVGTSAPTTKFEVSGTDATGTPFVSIDNSSSGSNALSMIRFRNQGTDKSFVGYTLGGGVFGDSSAQTLIAATSTGGPLVFYTNGIAAANERVRITSTGNVGIGTTSPTALTHIVGDTATLFNVASGSSSRLVVLEGGNVGINTTSPVHRLDVVSSAADVAGFYSGISSVIGFYNGGGTTKRGTIGVDSGGGVYSGTSANSLVLGADAGPVHIIANGGSATNGITVSTGGNVGIGTTSPDVLLHTSLAGARNTTKFQTYSTGATTYSILSLDKSDSDTNGTLADTDDGDILGLMWWRGVGGSALLRGAQISVTQNGTATVDAVPSNMALTTWNTSTENSNQLVLNTSGNVGIGTSTPGSTLHIYESGADATAKVETVTTTQAARFQMSAATSVNADWITYGSSFAGTSTGLNLAGMSRFNFGSNVSSILFDTGNSTAPFVFATNGSEKFRINGSGNVGIGTSSLEVKFELVGTASISENLYLGGFQQVNGTTSSSFAGPVEFNGTPLGTNINQGTVYINPGSAGTNNTVFGVAVGSSERLRVDAEGDVSTIGTFQSSSTSGTNQFSGNLTVSGNTTFGDSASDSVTFTARIGSHTLPTTDNAYNLGSNTKRWANFYAVNATFDNLISGGTASNSFTVNTDNSTADTENSSFEFERGSVTPNAAITWNASSDRFEFNDFPVYLTNKLTVAGTASSSFAGPTWFTGTPTGTSIQNGSIYINPSSATTNYNLFGVAVAGSARFQVDAEGDTLVHGSLGVENTIYDISEDTVRIDDDLQINGNDIKDSSQTARITIGSTNSITGNLNVDSNTLYVDASNNNVGIGTSSPATKLHLHETGVGGVTFKITDADTGVTSSDGFEIAMASDEAINIKNYENTNLALWTNSLQRMTIAAGGNVGIGSTSPAALLEVVGDVSTLFNVASGSSSRLVVLESGNIGIGTTSPNAKLDIIGTSGSGSADTSIRLYKSSGNSYMRLDRAATSQDQMITWQDAGVDKWYLGQRSTDGTTSFHLYGSTVGADVMTWLPSGNIGIGTISPATKFEVQGTASASYGLFGSLQIAGFSSTSYSRLGTDTTGYSSFLGAANDLLISGSLEVNSPAFFDSTASISGNVQFGSTPTFYADTLNARVGIGRVPTTEKLEVHGNIKLTGASTDTISNDSGDLVVTPSGGNFFVSTGEVGLGTTTAVGSVRLNVAGGNLRVAQDPGAAAANQLILNNTRGASNLANLIAFQGSGSNKWLLGNDISANGGQDFYIRDSVNSRTSLFIDASGRIGLGNSVTTPATTVEIASASAELRIRSSGSTSDATLSLWAGNSDSDKKFSIVSQGDANVDRLDILRDTTALVSIASGGNVGIGTTSPAGKLNIVSASSAIASTGALSLGSTGTPNALSMGFLDSNYAWIQSNGYDLNINGGGNRVGIGGTPSNILDIFATNPVVRAKATSTGYTLFRAENDSGTFQIGQENSSGGAILSGTGSYDGFVTLNHADSLHFGTNSAIRMTISDTGNVGIGTATPGAKFDVRDGNLILTDADVAHGMTDLAPTAAFGQLNVLNGTGGGLHIKGLTDTDQSAIFIDAIIGSTDPTDTATALLFRSGKANGSTFQALGNSETAFQFRNYTTDLLTILGGGNVGIGTTNVDAKLEIAGTASASGNVYLGLNSASNVGIGTTSPAYKLEVLSASDYGGIRLSQYATDATEQRVSITARHYNSATNPVSLIAGRIVSGENRIMIGTGAGSTVAATHITFNTAANSTTADGTERMRIDNTGNVGIGTTSPTALTHIIGDVSTLFNVASGSNSRFAVLESGNVGIGTTSPATILHLRGSDPRLRLEGTASDDWQVGLDTNDFTIYNVTDAITPFFISGTGGNIGIGTTSPGALLQVGSSAGSSNNTILVKADNTTGDPSIWFSVHGINDWSVGVDNSDSNKFKIGQDGPSGATQYLTINTSGNVGIGTTDPQYKLDVYGANATARFYNPNDVTSVIVRGGPNQNGAILRFYDNNNNGLSYFNGNGTLLGTSIQIANTGFYGFSSTGNVDGSVDTALYRNAAGVVEINSGTSGQYRDLQLRALNPTSGNVGIGTTSATATLHIVGDSTTLFNVASGSNSRFTVRENGNVGIGTATPGFLFEINGGTTTSGAGEANIVASLYGSTDAALRLRSNANSGTFADIRVEHNKGLRFEVNDNNYLSIASASGNVGIGTTSPARLLHVSGTGNVYGRFETTNTTGAGIQLKDTASDWLIQADGANPSTGALAFYSLTASAYRMTINGNGNVGIGLGSTSAVSVLDVKGTAASGGGTVQTMRITADANAALTINAGATTNYAYQTFAQGGTGKFEIGYSGSGDSAGSLFYLNNNVQGGAANAAMVINPSNNIGIGTTAPTAKTHIVGDTTNLLNVASGSTSRFLVTENGRVGINTSTVNEFGGVDWGTGNPRLNVHSGTNNTTIVGIQGDIEAHLMLADNGASANQKIWDLATDAGVFYLRPVNSAGSTTHDSLVILNNGNIGIGTTSPTAATHIVSNQSTLFDVASGSNSRFTVLENGNVGIGTATPGAFLHSANTSSTASARDLYMTRTNEHLLIRLETLTSAKSPFIDLVSNQGSSADNSIAAIRTVSTRSGSDVRNGSLEFLKEGSSADDKSYFAISTYNTSLTEKMRITATGNVGIGTTSPTALTHIVGDTSTLFNVASGSNSRFAVLESGNVGIGTTSPNAKVAIVGQLHVGPQAENAVSGAGIVLPATAGGAGTASIGINFRGDGQAHANIAWMPTERNFIFRSGNGPVDTSDSYGGVNLFTNGNVGIGTTSTTTKLHVVGDNSTLFNVASGSNSRFTVLEGGNVGIGTTSPGETLQVVGSGIVGISGATDVYKSTNSGSNYGGNAAPEFTVVSSSGTSANILIKNGNGAGSNSPVLGFANLNGATNYILGATIYAAMTDSTAGSEDQDLVFSAQAAGAAAAEAMRIKAGNLGIGETSPGTKLDVKGDTHQVTLNAPSAGSYGGIIFEENGSAKAYISYINSAGISSDRYDNLEISTNSGNAGGDIDFRPKDVSKMRITVDGNVGIGTTTPSNLLDIYSTATASFDVWSGGTSTDKKFTFKSNYQGAGNSERLGIINGAGTELMTIASSGFVGIGTTNPSATLQTKVTTAGTTALSNAVSRAAGFFEGSSSSTWGLAIGLDNTNEIPTIQGVDRAQTTARNMALNPLGGNVGIGTTNPGAKLQINTTGDASQTPLRIRNSSGLQMFEFDIDSGGTPGLNIGNSSGSTKIHLDPDGSYFETGNVGIGTTGPTDLLHIEDTDATVSTTQLTLEGRYNGYGAGVNFVSRTSSGGTRVSMGKITADGEGIWDTTAANQDANLRFFTAENGSLTERVRIGSSGNVGIGTTTTTGALLSLAGSGVSPVIRGMNDNLRLESQDSMYIVLDHDNDNADTESLFWTKNGTSSVIMQLNEIGTLQIGGGTMPTNSATYAIQFANAKYIEWSLAAGSSGAQGAYFGLSADNDFVFYDGGDTQALIRDDESAQNDDGWVTATVDYGEFMEKLDPSEEIGIYEVVGVKGGKITKNTEGATMFMVTATDAGIRGGNPMLENYSRDSDEAWIAVAFIGQMPVMVEGEVREGDYIIPSDLHDGKAKAVSKNQITPAQFNQLIGVALEDSIEPVYERVNMITGLAYTPDSDSEIDRELYKLNQRKGASRIINVGVGRNVPPPLYVDSLGNLKFGSGGSENTEPATVTVTSSGGGTAGISDVLQALANNTTTIFKSIWAKGDVIAQGFKKTYFSTATYLGVLAEDIAEMAANWSSRDIMISGNADSAAIALFQGNSAQAADDSKVDLADNGNYLSTYGVDSTRGEIQLSGSSQLINGEAKIFFDYSFSSIISGETPIKVIITPTSAFQGQLYVDTKNQYGFVVKELNASENGNFDWLVIARRKGFETDSATTSPSSSSDSSGSSVTPSPTPSSTDSGSTVTPTPTASPSTAPEPTVSPSPSATPTPSSTDSGSTEPIAPSATPEPTPSPTSSPEPTPSSTDSGSTVTPTPTASPSTAPEPTVSPSPSATPTPSSTDSGSTEPIAPSATTQ